MGLSWYHAEMAKDSAFEVITSGGVKIEKDTVSIGELSLNHIRFVILEELQPGDIVVQS